MDDRRRCSAHSSRTGDLCKKAPILGGSVCRTHGGSAPQVKRKALERLKELQAPAVEVLARAIDAEDQQLNRKGEVIGLGPDHAVRLRAATAVLDRTGMGPHQGIDLNVKASLHFASLIAALDASPEV
jgi:hypothetical protein